MPPPPPKLLITPNQYKRFEAQSDKPFLNARLYVRSDPRPGRSGGQFEVPIQISNPHYTTQEGAGKKFKAFKNIVKSASSAAIAAAPIAASTGNPYAAVGLASAGLVGSVITGGGSRAEQKKISRYSLVEDPQLGRAKKKT
jgi:hypothetical protein